ncbi:hypothetical protein Taro_030415 [Colocasia esculenta]|uniref:Uncharacterized protein n=1 Tax=Colocasia esculenta TaxID=4460 RepID=A0A843VXV4_COLES|nr:hypothetical protein [Colocasia esculenta]
MGLPEDSFFLLLSTCVLAGRSEKWPPSTVDDNDLKPLLRADAKLAGSPSTSWNSILCLDHRAWEYIRRQVLGKANQILHGKHVRTDQNLQLVGVHEASLTRNGFDKPASKEPEVGARILE